MLCIGDTESDRRAIRFEFVRLFGTSAATAKALFPVEVTAEYSGSDRAVMYARGSASFFVTTRILVVDLLTKRLCASRVGRVVVLNAHRLRDESPEAFAVQLIQRGNPAAHVCGLSAVPQALRSGARVEQVMALLRASSLSLWPRFHEEISCILDALAPEVIELQQPMTRGMAAVHSGLIEAMELCLTELRSSGELDATGLTVEHGLLTPIDELLRQQKGSAWHALPRRLRLLVGDLGTLRRLSLSLLAHDATTFLGYLKGLSEAEGQRSVWLSLDMSRAVFDAARQRVNNAAGGGVATLCLEPLPKWQLLGDVIEEVCSASDADAEEEVSVLVVARDAGTVLQLHSVLSEGAAAYMDRAYARLCARTPLASASRKRKGRSQRSGGRGAQADAGNKARASSAAAIVGTPGGGRALRDAGVPPSDAGPRAEAPPQAVSDGLLLRPSKCAFDLSRPCRVHFHAASDGPCSSSLWEVRPDAVVMYDAVVPAVREIEVFCAARRGAPGAALKCYMLMYEHSIEAQQFVSEVQGEKDAFEGLINAHLRRGQHDLANGGSAPAAQGQAAERRKRAPVGASGLPSRALTNPVGPERVVVDIREFMSTLPLVLHNVGLEVVPITLEVGDYVLSPDVCVERKSLSDLRGSLASGRLYKQATAMSRSYAKPVLLVELAENAALSLSEGGDLGDEVSVKATMSKLALLVMHFPDLRLVWSRGGRQTAALFRMLKGGAAEPDAAQAAAVKMPETLGVAGAHPFHAPAAEALSSLPGVYDMDTRSLTRAHGSLRQLAKAGQAALASSIPAQRAEKLHAFLHGTSHGTADKQTSD